MQHVVFFITVQSLYMTLYIILIFVWFQKISILPPQKGLEIPGRREGGGGSQRPRNWKEYMNLNWNFRRGGWGGGVIGQMPSVGGMDIFWNHTFFKLDRKSHDYVLIYHFSVVVFQSVVLISRLPYVNLFSEVVSSGRISNSKWWLILLSDGRLNLFWLKIFPFKEEKIQTKSIQSFHPRFL